MSSTNKTTNYELSQYIGTDKPTYLGDYNSDMLKIDTRMKANQTATETNATAITTVSGTATTALEKATANETAIGNVSTTATQALTKANANETAILALQANVNIVDPETLIGTYEGKNLYRSIIDYTPTSAIGSTTGFTNFDIPIDSVVTGKIDHVYNMRGYIYGTSGNNRLNRAIPFFHTDGTYSLYLDSISESNNVQTARYTFYKYQLSTWIDVYPTIRTIIEYTKKDEV